MMVIDPINNKAASTVATMASPKLVSGEKKAPKRRDSSKRLGDSLKRNTAKELKAPKAPSRTRSKSPSGSPPTRSVSRKSSSNKLGSKDKKDKKKKKIKKVGEENEGLDHTSTHSEESRKKPKRRSSKMGKNLLRDSENSKNRELSAESSHSTASTRDVSDKSLLKKLKKPLEKTLSKKGLKKKSSSEADPAFVSPPVSSPRNRTLSFESIHGKSIHKPKTRRAHGNSENADKPYATLAPPPPPPQFQNGYLSSPPQQHGFLSSPPSAGGRKTSVLKAKREKQEQERRANLKRSTPRSAPSKNKEDYINEVLGVVNADTTPRSVSRKSAKDEGSYVDPDECSSQSSSCSVVSDGSYEKDDLLSQSSDPTDEMLDNVGNLRGENPAFGEHSITIDADHELSPSKLAPNKTAQDLLSPTDIHFTPNPEDGGGRDESFKDTLMEAMASSMSALHEVDEGESPMNSPVVAAKMKMPKKTLLKKIPEQQFSPSGRPIPTRGLPKRAKSDITALNRMSNNVLEIRLPGQRKTVTRQRSLTFNEKVRVKRIPCQAQVNGGDNSELWFQPQEYDAIKRKTMALIRAVQDDQTGGVTYCTRGLERYFAVDAVQEKRNDAWDSVLDEQEAQRSNQEEFSAERLSMAYSQTTRLSAQEAIERGRLDEDAIARYTKKMRNTLRRTYSNAV